MIRAIEPGDVPAVLGLVHELAEHELEPDAVLATADDLTVALFAESPHAFAHVAVAGDESGASTAVLGVAVWTMSYSTWTGQHGIHLVDLVVTAGARAAGLGRALVRELARLCVERGYRRLDWEVLDALADDAVPGHPGPHGFYRRLGGAPREDWTAWRLDGDELQRLGRS